MPWCEDCSKYLTPNSVRADGTCPTCGRPVGETERLAQEAAEQEGTPWHFKVMVIAVTGYLGWRLVQVVARIG